MIGRVRSELLQALAEEKTAAGLLPQALAQKLDVPRSLLDGQLFGSKGLTLRALADIAWALDRDVVFELRRRDAEAPGQNVTSETSTIEAGRTVFIGTPAALSSTLPSKVQTRVGPQAAASEKPAR